MALDQGKEQKGVSIGIDIGGTKMLGCLFDGDVRTPAKSITWPTARRNGGQAVLDQAAELARTLYSATDQKVQCLGVAVPELVDNGGRPASDWNFDWRGLEIDSAFDLGLPVRIASDVRAAAFAESRLSVLADADPFLYVTWSTGIAHTLVIDGKPYSGANGYALHFAGGNLATQCGKCKNLSPFNLELFAGGRALGDRYAEVKGQPGLTARDLFEACQYDDFAKQMVDEAIESLASYLGQLINILDPAAMVIGGGMGNRADVFDRLDERTREFIWADGARNLPIAASNLNGNAAAIGAVFLAELQEKDVSK